MSEFPSGTITFLFTDIEGSTRLLHELGPQSYAAALAEHHRALRKAFVAHDGVEGDTQGDAFFVAFQTAPAAVAAASELTDALAGGPIRVRVGIHTGTAFLAEEGYVGVDVNRAARIAACGHGGQILISAATASLLDANALRDLGEHRLKDLISPERIYQLGGENFPPLRSLHQTNLPIPSTPFLGRERELGEVLGLLSQPDIRLLTLIGPGGMGKTRLGLQAAGGLAGSYADGVWWVPLAPLRDSELVLEQASHALGAKDGLAEHIGNRSMLLFFDNFEQVVEAGSEIAALLTFCPKLDLLVTSREPLHVTGEQEYQVLPLVPSDAVGLFVARARAIEPDFETDDSVAEICRRLDDLPLALELAAARVKALSTEQILSRLEQRLPLLTGGARDLPERQRTLRATIHWSHELLTPEEQLLFARLAVFAGGCSLAAAEEVAAADLDILQSLVDKSLVRLTERRYWMLETIREYAIEQLDASGEAAELGWLHAEYFLALAEESEPRVREYSSRSLDLLEREHDNLRAALDQFEESGDGQRALRLAGALSEFWGIKGHFMEGRRRLRDALGADERPTAARAKALNGASNLAAGGDVTSARLWAQEALSIHRELSDEWGIAESLLMLGSAYEGEWERAQDYWKESLQLFKELGDQHHTLLATRLLAWSYSELGDPDQAGALHEENLGAARAAGNEHIEAHSLEALAHMAVTQGRPLEATEMLKRAYQIHRELEDPYRVAIAVGRFARVVAARGDAGTAATLLSSSEALLEELGARPPWVATMNDDTLAAISTQLDEAAVAEAQERGRTLTADNAVALALDALE